MHAWVFVFGLVTASSGFYVFEDECVVQTNGFQGQGFRCPGTSRKCIHVDWICDDDDDCPGGQDEWNCEERLAMCPEDPAKCRPVRQDPEVAESKQVHQSNSNETTELSLLGRRVANKLGRVEGTTFLEAERLINQVLYMAQTGTLSNTTVIMERAMPPPQPYSRISSNFLRQKLIDLPHNHTKQQA